MSYLPRNSLKWHHQNIAKKSNSSSFKTNSDTKSAKVENYYGKKKNQDVDQEHSKKLNAKVYEALHQDYHLKSICEQLQQQPRRLFRGKGSIYKCNEIQVKWIKRWHDLSLIWN